MIKCLKYVYLVFVSVLNIGNSFLQKRVSFLGHKPSPFRNVIYVEKHSWLSVCWMHVEFHSIYSDFSFRIFNLFYFISWMAPHYTGFLEPKTRTHVLYRLWKITQFSSIKFNYKYNRALTLCTVIISKMQLWKGLIEMS